GRLAGPVGPGVRNDGGLESGGGVTVHYDRMIAKLIVAAPDRHAAIARLRRALDEYVALGVTTNLPLLRAIAGHPAFAAGATHTDFLQASGLAGSAFAPQAPPPEVLAAAALADAARPSTADGRDPWRAGPWRLLRDDMRLRYLFGTQEQLVRVTQTAEGWRIAAGEAMIEAAVV